MQLIDMRPDRSSARKPENRALENAPLDIDAEEQIAITRQIWPVDHVAVHIAQHDLNLRIGFSQFDAPRNLVALGRRCKQMEVGESNG
jgi:hypothetical protein